MKPTGNSKEDMPALLKVAGDAKNDLQYIREYFDPLYKREIYLSGQQG